MLLEAVRHARAYRIDYCVWGEFASPQKQADWEAVNGWLLCDGRELPTLPPYYELFLAIGSAWGADKTGGKFNLPNLQGYFLRGVDPSRDHVIDPDNNTRTNPYGGNHGARVGSYQSFATALPNAATARAADPEDPKDPNASPKSGLRAQGRTTTG
jgi:Phage Tail Collar Domain